MFFKRIVTKGLAQYSYMVGDGETLAIIDPMRDVEVYMEEARLAGMRIEYIFETHRNEDFLVGSRELSEKTGAKVYISDHEDLAYEYGEGIKEGFEVNIKGIRLKVLHTPGHTLGHLSYVLYEKDNKIPYMVFTGDTLFMGDVGRTDFYGKEELNKMTGLLYDSIFNKILPLGDHVLLFPAHGAGSACGDSMDEREYSTLGYERLNSKILQVNGKDDFIKKHAKMRIKPRYFNAMEKRNLLGEPFVGGGISLNPLTLDEFKNIKDEVLLLHTQNKESYIGGHIPGSIYMPKVLLSSFLGAIYETNQKLVFVGSPSIGELEELYWYARRIGFDNIIGYLADGLGKWEQSGEELEKTRSITAIKFKELPKNGDFILLDIRKKEEIEADDPDKNRINIPLQNIYKCLDYLDYKKTIYVLCASGERSTIGASYLKAKNYDARIITGGVEMLEAFK